MVTATLTRPTTISPTMRCDRKVYFVERIDIGTLVAPHPRTITLEPISRRSKAKHQAKRLVEPVEKRQRKTEHSSESSAPGESGTSSGPSTDAQSQQQRSLSASQISIVSDDTSSARTGSISQSPTSSENPNVSRTSLGGRIITTKITSLSSGCLRGDNIHVKIEVSHTKHVKSLYGAIVTLYRQARTDLHPAIPLGPTEKGTTAKYEDYYPRSMTGLGGLSLSGAGSSHVFRKDLSQTMLPLLVDPASLTAEINAKVRVPEEAFPTIATVPGGMISFKYYVEVVLDVQGKLAGQDRQLSSFGAVATSPIHACASDGPEGERSAFSAFGPQIADTSHIRRDRSVIACTFEMVVGTNDSRRRKGKNRIEVLDPPESQNWAVGDSNIVGSERLQTEEIEGTSDQAQGWDRLPHGYQQSGQNGSRGENRSEDGPTPQPPRVPSYDRPPPEEPLPFPPPQLPDQTNMSEKDRIRLRELQLLPSQPPGLDSNEDLPLASSAPTAPYLPDEDPYHRGAHDDSMPGPSAPAYQANALSPRLALADNEFFGAEQLPLPPTPQYEGQSGAGESSSTAAALAEAIPGAGLLNGGPPVGDDKQELQRRRLEMEASAPPPRGSDNDDGVGGRGYENGDTRVRAPEQEYGYGYEGHGEDGYDEQGFGYEDGEAYGYDYGWHQGDYDYDYDYDHDPSHGYEDEGRYRHSQSNGAGGTAASEADAAPSAPRLEDLEAAEGASAADINTDDAVAAAAIPTPNSTPTANDSRAGNVESTDGGFHQPLLPKYER